MLPVKGNFCSSSKLKDKCPMCLHQLDTQEHLFICKKFSKTLSMKSFMDLSMKKEDCKELENRLEQREKVINKKDNCLKIPQGPHAPSRAIRVKCAVDYFSDGTLLLLLFGLKEDLSNLESTLLEVTQDLDQLTFLVGFAGNNGTLNWMQDFRFKANLLCTLHHGYL